MTIIMTEYNYNYALDDIRKCALGEMCKIKRVVDNNTGETTYWICADISAGWTTRSGRMFHAIEHDPDTTSEGLGTFYMVKQSVNEHGEHVLEFTDDLNPELP